MLPVVCSDGCVLFRGVSCVCAMFVLTEFESKQRSPRTFLLREGAVNNTSNRLRIAQNVNLSGALFFAARSSLLLGMHCSEKSNSEN